MVTLPPSPTVFVEEAGTGAPPLRPAPSAVTAFLGLAADGPVHQPVVVQSEAGFEQVFGPDFAGGTLPLAVRQYFANGGQQAVVVRLPANVHAASAWVPTLPDARRRREGVFALDPVAFNLLCMPPPSPERDFSLAGWARAANYCRQRGAVLLLDAPAAWQDTATALRGMQALRTAVGPAAASHVAVYHPRLRVPTPDGQSQPVAPCGAVAGVIARTDAQHGIWTAPAGPEAVLNGALAPSQLLNDASQALLNAAGLNLLRVFSAPSPVIWGARTLAGADGWASDWKYLPVRRLSLHVSRTVIDGTGWVAFEPQGEPLWARLRATVDDFLASLWRLGALMGDTQSQAWMVRCDRSTHSAHDLASGRVRLLIGLAPLRPAEFVVLRLTLRSAA